MYFQHSLFLIKFALFFPAVASPGSGAGSVIAVLQVITVSQIVYRVNATRAASRPRSATQTPGGVSARCVPFVESLFFNTLSGFGPVVVLVSSFLGRSACYDLKCLQRNVAGLKCDTCRDGSFYFDLSNPHGCTSCFCFGAIDRCQSSSKRRGKVCRLFRAPACL